MPTLCTPRPKSEFTYESAKNKLIVLRLGEPNGPKVTFVVPGDVIADDVEDRIGDGAEFSSRQGALLRLAGFVDIGNELSVGCAGSIISYIQRKRSSSFLPGDSAAQAMHRISSIEMFSLSGSMQVVHDLFMLYDLTSFLGSSIPILCCPFRSSNQKLTHILTIKALRRPTRAPKKVFPSMVSSII